MENIGIIKIENKELDVKIDPPHKISKSYVGTYKEIGEHGITTKFTLIKNEDEKNHVSWEVILQDSFDSSTEDMICMGILNHVEDLNI